MEFVIALVFLTCLCFLPMTLSNGPNECTEGVQVGNYFAIQSGGEERFTLWPASTVKTVIMDDPGTSSKTEPISGSAKMKASCCGEVKEWNIDVGRPNGINIKGEKIKMQFWRDVGTDMYRLIGEEEYTIPSHNNYFHPVSNYASKTTVSVIIGDILGFTGNYLEFKTRNNYDKSVQGTVHAKDNLNPLMDNDYNVPDEIAEAQGTKMVGFALSAALKPSNKVPACQLNLLNGASFSDDTAVGTVLGNVFMTAQGDPAITKYLFSLEDTDKLKGIKIDRDTGKINVSSPLSVKPPSQQFTLTGRITEDICLRYGECQNTITITWSNKKINITNSPGAGNLKESISLSTPLFTVETEDENRLEGLDQNPTCKILNVNPPNGGGFSIKKHQWVSSQWVLSFDGTPALNSANSPVTVNYQCDDEYGSSDTGSYVLTVDPNLAPTLVNKVNATANCILASANAQTIRKDDAVVFLGPVDVEGDTIEYKFIKSNSSSPFYWFKDRQEIRASQDLSTLLHGSHDFTIQLWDKWTVARPNTYKICLTITGLNTIPEFNNCPMTQAIPENQLSGALVARAGVSDSNKDRDKQIHTFSWTVTPAVFKDSFSLNINSGEITIDGNSLANDFEQANKILKGGCINFAVKVYDGIHHALKDCNICINIINVNDPPVFKKKQETVEFYEQTAPGTLPAIDTSFVDEDENDKHTFKIISGNSDGYYQINTTSGQISLAKDCDYETGCPPETTITIEVTDDGGLTSRMEVILKVLDKNDNAPTFGGMTCTISMTESTLAGDTVANVKATDADSGANGQLNYYVAGIGLGSEYFNVDNTGNVKLRKSLDHLFSVQYKITICANDAGNPSMRGCVHCDVKIDIAVTTAEQVDRTEPCYFCTEGGVAMFTIFMVLLAIALIIAAYLLNKYVLGNCISRCWKQLYSPRKPYGKPKPKPRPQTPEVRRPRPEPKQKPKEVDVEQFRISREPPEVAQQTKFDFWRTSDMELHNKNPVPSNTVARF